MKAIHDVPAPAKLNLFLHVVGKRPDGYHLLQSIFALIDWADTLHFERRTDGLLARHDSGNALPPDDLCLRAARALQTQSGCDLGVDIHIEKRVPAGAGMGGGSSDAASTLLALNRLWGLNWPLSRLLRLGLTLGADVPFFLGGRHAFVEGIGEKLLPIDLPSQRFAVLKPAASIRTPDIFSSPILARSDFLAIVAGFPGHIKAEQFLDGFGHNDLQKPAEALCPEVGQALKLIEQAFGNSRMTGSGSAVFARVTREEESRLPIWPQELPANWVGRMCSSLDVHPLHGWAEN